MLSCEFCEIFKNTFFTEHFWTTAWTVSVHFCSKCWNNKAVDNKLFKLNIDKHWPNYPLHNNFNNVKPRKTLSWIKLIVVFQKKRNVVNFFQKASQISWLVCNWSKLTLYQLPIFFKSNGCELRKHIVYYSFRVLPASVIVFTG